MAEQDRDQRTEQATPQRIRKAYEEGQIGFSAELVGGLMLATGAIFFWLVGEWFFGSIGETIRDRVTYFEPMILEQRTILMAISNDVMRIGFACLVLILPLFLVALLGGALQTNFNVSFKPLNLKWEKLSVPAGVKKIFSSSSAVRGALSIAKAAVIVLIIYLIGKAQLEKIAVSGFSSFQDLMFAMCQILLYVSLAIAAMMTLVGIVDLAFQKWKQMQDLKMSIQDIRDEHKESEGDPLIRARVKRLQAEMGRKRMLSEVPKSTVVITNPTHFAVALQYDRKTMVAPVVLAKGSDFLAKKIIEIAKENGVPVVERKPVARFLYFNIKVGSEIPFELYQAVAEILNYVNRLKGAA